MNNAVDGNCLDLKDLDSTVQCEPSLIPKEDLNPQTSFLGLIVDIDF